MKTSGASPVVAAFEGRKRAVKAVLHRWSDKAPPLVANALKAVDAIDGDTIFARLPEEARREAESVMASNWPTSTKFNRIWEIISHNAEVQSAFEPLKETAGALCEALNFFDRTKLRLELFNAVR